MQYAIVKDGIPKIISGPFTDELGVQHPYSVLNLWGADELAEIGVYPVERAAVPSSKTIVGYSLVYENDAVTMVYDLEDIDLASVKSAMCVDIDARAEQERQKYITTGAGQAMTYQAKADEAAHFIETNGAGQYPFLLQEVGITADTLAGVAEAVFDMHSLWLIYGANIERARLKAKRDIDAAETYDDIIAVIPEWP